MAAGDIIVIKDSPAGRKGNYFDGTDDYVLHDAHAVARVAANDTTGTYSAWIFLEDYTSRTILSAGDNDSANEFLKLYMTGASKKLAINLKQGGADQFTVAETTASIPLKTWTYVAVVQNGTQPALYVNGLNVAVTNAVATDLTMWYDELANCDKFAIGVLESNNTHTGDWKGAIGRVKYWNKALTAAEVLKDYHGTALDDDATYLQFDIDMEYDGTTDSGLGADNGTLMGNAHYGGVISPFTYQVEANVSGHAAETINIFQTSPTEWTAIIKRGD